MDLGIVAIGVMSLCVIAAAYFIGRADGMEEAAKIVEKYFKE